MREVPILTFKGSIYSTTLISPHCVYILNLLVTEFSTFFIDHTIIAVLEIGDL